MNAGLLQQYAMRLVGTPYIFGGDDPLRGFDCSGLVQEILLAFGGHPAPKTDLTAQGLYDKLSDVGQYNSTNVGACAFYGKHYHAISHVGMIIYPDLIIEAGAGTSNTKTVQDAIEQNAYVRLRPLNHRKDLIACILPKYP